MHLQWVEILSTQIYEQFTQSYVVIQFLE
jgi:hypothetical protein